MIKNEISAWLEGDFDKKTKREIKKLIDGKDVGDAFDGRLKFGTGGMRGIMGMGSNRMNTYTVRGAIYGLVEYVKKTINMEDPKNAKREILIGYDTRNNSVDFAKEAAKVIVANDIVVRIFADPIPLPLVSFYCHYKNCLAAIMITASHNPPKYNGIKIFWSDGIQVLPPNDIGIVEEVNRIGDLSGIQVGSLKNTKKIKWESKDCDEIYVKTLGSIELCREDNKKHGKNLKIVYSSLHGTGIRLAGEALARWNFTNVRFLSQQNVPDGNFPTAPNPNPENSEALSEGIREMLENDFDIFLATDPDADRIGVVANNYGKEFIFSGNQVYCLALYHILDNLYEKDKMPSKPAIIKSMVTSDMAQEIARDYEVCCFNVLPGFKYIGELVRKWKGGELGGHSFVFGGEESCGYLPGGHDLSRDKDGIMMCNVLCEMALQAKIKGKTIVDILFDIYEKYGVYREQVKSITIDSQGVLNVQKIMDNIRGNPRDVVSDICIFEDYKSSKSVNVKNGAEHSILLPKSDVVVFKLEDKSKIIIRPSGTEPKIKIYASCCCLDEETSVADGIKVCDDKIETIIEKVSSAICRQ